MENICKNSKDYAYLAQVSAVRGCFLCFYKRKRASRETIVPVYKNFIRYSAENSAPADN